MAKVTAKTTSREVSSKAVDVQASTADSSSSLEALQAKIKTLQSENDALQKDNEALSASMTNLEKVKSDKRATIDIDGDQFAFVAPAFIFNGHKIVSAEVAKDPNKYNNFIERAKEKLDNGKFKYCILEPIA